jgi:antitoxin MazE
MTSMAERGFHSGARGIETARQGGALDLKGGNEIEIHLADEREFGVSRKPGRKKLLKRLRAFRGHLPADFKFDRTRRTPR